MIRAEARRRLNELSFKLGGSLAFKDAMTRARPTILEPS